jgi:MFS family permease
MVEQLQATDIETPTQESTISQVLVLGLLTLLTITSASILHANQPEFIFARFPGLSELDVSFFDTVLYVAYLVFGITTGIVSNRVGKRRIFIAIGTLGASLFYILMTTTLVYPILLAFRFAQGAFIVMAWQTLMTLILDLSSSKNRGRNMGIYGFFLALAMGLGPMLGGLISEVSVLMPYYVAATLSALVFILSMSLLREPQELSKNPVLKDSLRVVQQNPKIIVPGLFNFVDRLHMGFIIFILPYFIVVTLGLGPSMRGMAMGIFALPFIALQYPVGKISDRIGRYKLLVLGSLAYGVVLCVVGYFGQMGFGVLVVLLFTLGVFSGVTSPPSMAMVGDSVNKKDHAMGMGFFNFMGNIGMIVGPVVGGLFWAYGNLVIAFLVAGLIELVSLIFNVIIIRRFREQTPSEHMIL